jgi:hypothetical protein
VNGRSKHKGKQRKSIVFTSTKIEASQDIHGDADPRTASRCSRALSGQYWWGFGIFAKWI